MSGELLTSNSPNSRTIVACRVSSTCQRRSLCATNRATLLSRSGTLVGGTCRTTFLRDVATLLEPTEKLTPIYRDKHRTFGLVLALRQVAAVGNLVLTQRPADGLRTREVVGIGLALASGCGRRLLDCRRRPSAGARPRPHAECAASRARRGSGQAFASPAAMPRCRGPSPAAGSTGGRSSRRLPARGPRRSGRRTAASYRARTPSVARQRRRRDLAPTAACGPHRVMCECPGSTPRPGLKRPAFPCKTSGLTRAGRPRWSRPAGGVRTGECRR
jgi:hypothetical protein